MTPATLDQSTEPEATAATMRAIVQDAYGVAPEEVLRVDAIARPAIADDQVLVRVVAASVDRGTWHLMAGLPYLMRAAGFGVRTPKATNPGRCFAGTVESTGKDVTGFTAGDQVFGTTEGPSPSTWRPRRGGSPPSRRATPTPTPQPSPSPG